MDIVFEKRKERASKVLYIKMMAFLSIIGYIFSLYTLSFILSEGYSDKSYRLYEQVLGVVMILPILKRAVL